MYANTESFGDYQQYYQAPVEQPEASSPPVSAQCPQPYYDYTTAYKTTPSPLATDAYSAQNAAYQNYAQYYQSYTPVNSNYYYGNGQNFGYQNYYYQPAQQQLVNKPSTTPTPPATGQYTYQTTTEANDSTPEKPVMNDSGIDIISPQFQLNQSSVLVNSTAYLERVSPRYPSTDCQQAQFDVNALRNEPPIFPQTVSKSEETTGSSVEPKQVDAQQPEQPQVQDSNDTLDDMSDDESTENANPSKKTSDKENEKDFDPCKPPKPYLEIIANAILSSKVKMMQLHEIYNFMENQYQYFAKNINKSWRNSVRHNLSLNECFVKACRGSNGKGNYWRIHPLCEREFIRGNFRRKSFKQAIRAGNQANQRQQTQVLSEHVLNAQLGQQAYGMVPPGYPYYAFNYPKSAVPNMLAEQSLNSAAHSSIYSQSNETSNTGASSSHRYRPY